MKHSARLLVLFPLLIVACAGGDSTSGAEPDDDPLVCGGRERGTWNVHFDEIGNDCYTLVDSMIVAPGDVDIAKASCTGPVQVSANKCSVYEDVTCGDQHLTGTYHWSADGSSAKGQITVIFESNVTADACEGIYNVTVTRLK